MNIRFENLKGVKKCENSNSNTSLKHLQVISPFIAQTVTYFSLEIFHSGFEQLYYYGYVA